MTHVPPVFYPKSGIRIWSVFCLADFSQIFRRHNGLCQEKSDENLAWQNAVFCLAKGMLSDCRMWSFTTQKDSFCLHGLSQPLSGAGGEPVNLNQ